jgi:hypothetical protein
MNTTAGHEIETSPCPGPVPTSLEHAERCRACGKCGTIIWPPADALAGPAGNSIN